MNSHEQKNTQTEQPHYVGHAVPRFIRFAWTVLIIFSIIYAFVYLVPDLKEWIQKAYVR